MLFTPVLLLVLIMFMPQWNYFPAVAVKLNQIYLKDQVRTGAVISRFSCKKVRSDTVSISPTQGPLRNRTAPYTSQMD